MKILISSHLFAPSIGGIEQASDILASEFVRADHEVRVVTQTLSNPEVETSYPVFRQPSKAILLTQLRWCDVYLQNNISLESLWPALAIGKTTLIVHQTWMCRPDGSRGWRDRLKGWATRLVARNLAVSKALAGSIPAPCVIVPNPYRDDLFVEDTRSPRDRDLVFVGRLVSDKGVDLLLSALKSLAEHGLHATATIIGGGPEEAGLKVQCHRLGLNGSVEFVGPKTGGELCRLLNRHRIMVVPSRWKEPFGIVALEGIASGCVIVGSEGGGLGDAIGACGLTFPNGDASALEQCLQRLLTDDHLRAKLRAGAPAHLARHHSAAVAEVFLGELSRLSP